MITKHPTSRVLIIHTLGNLDALKAEHYRTKIRALINEGYHSIIFDLAETDYISSSGLGLLVEVYNALTHLNGTYRLINCGEQVTWLLKQSQLDRLLLDQSLNESELEATQPRFDRLHELMNDEIVLLSHFQRVIANTLRETEPLAIAEVMLAGMLEALQAPSGIVYLLSEGGDHLELAHVRGEGPGLEAPQRFPLKIGRLEYSILHSREITCLHLPDPSGQNAEFFTRLGYESLVAAAIGTESGPLGLVAINASEETERILQTARPLIKAFSQVCAQALEKAALIKEVTQRNEELSRALSNLSQAHHSLINAGRLAAMGTVIAGLGHQLNNKLVPVIGYCQLLHNKRDLPEEVIRKIDMIQTASGEIQLVIEKLLRLSKVRDRLEASFNPVERIGTALDLLSGIIEKHPIAVETDFSEQDVTIPGDGDLILQALLAILHRACTSFRPDQADARLHLETRLTGDHYCLEIRDNGLDLEEFEGEDWLDPMVPLNAISSGQIFNYNIPRGVIRRHHGALEVESLPEKGKRVIITLPVRTASSTGAGQASGRMDA